MESKKLGTKEAKVNKELLEASMLVKKQIKQVNK